MSLLLKADCEVEKDRKGVNFRCTAIRLLWCDEANAISTAIGYAEHYSRSHDAMIRVYDDADNVVETHQHKGDFKEW